MSNEFFVPKTKQQMQQWFVHVEQVLQGQAKNFKDDDIASIDRLYLAEGFSTIRMREYPRMITLPEATDLDEKIKSVGIPRDWLFKMFKIDKYSKMYESEMLMIRNTLQSWVNLYKKSIEPKEQVIESTNDEGTTLQQALLEESIKIDEGLPKSFMNSGGK